MQLWVLLLMGLILLIPSVHLPEALERIELSLLDIRLQARSNVLTPSKDIIFVSLDRRSRDYARNHPEMGISGYMLPRHRVAQLINFFSERGAKSIVLDVIFEEPQSPEGDQALSKAIQQAGNVYLASAAELTFSEYKDRRLNNPASARLDLLLSFVNYRLLPYLSMQASRYELAPEFCGNAYLLTGLGPFMDVSRALAIPEGMFQSHWQFACRKNDYFHQGQLASTNAGLARLPAMESAPAGPELRDSLYLQQCQHQMYQEMHRHNPGFLARLEEKKSPQLSVSNPKAPLSNAYCITSHIQEPFLKQARGVGITSVDYDRDTSMRQVPLVYQLYQGNLYGYLGLQPALDLLNPTRAALNGNSLQINERNIPLQNGSQLMLSWRSPKNLVESLYEDAGKTLPIDVKNAISFDTGNPDLGYGHLYRMISVIDVLRRIEMGRADESTPALFKLYNQPDTGEIDFKDKIIIYGDAIEDVHRTPVGSRIFGPEILATAMDMVLHDRHFVQQANPWGVGLCVLLLCGLLFWSQVAIPRLQVAFIAGLSLLALFWVYNFILFIQAAWWVPLVIPTAVMALSLMSGVLYRYYVHDREKRQLTDVFSHYVSPQVMDHILAHPESSLENLAGVEKNLTVLFADLQGFTERFAIEEPQQMVRQLNEFFSAMTRIILKHQGTYDKYIGDAVMAFFGAPVEFEDHAAKACAAALEMQAELEALNARWRAEGIRELKLGIGLSTGEMIVGNFGSDVLQNFTVMGNAVNLGARLEALTRKVQSPIVISEETRQQAGVRIQARDLGLQEVKGFSEPVRAYALEAMAGNPDRERDTVETRHPAEATLKKQQV